MPPVIGAVVGLVIGVVSGAGFLGTVSWTLVGVSLAYSISGMLEARKLKKIPSPRYASPFGAIDNTISNQLAVPIPYGEFQYAGNIVWQGPPEGGETVHRFIVIGEGEIESISKVRVNDIPIEDLPGCSYTAYLGTSAQTVDSRAGGLVKGLKNVAYLAITLQTSDDLKGHATVTCIVRGRKVKVYNGSSWVEQYSNNPVWCLRDLLINKRYGWGVNEAWIDDDSWYEVAQYCGVIVDGLRTAKLNGGIDNVVTTIKIDNVNANFLKEGYIKIDNEDIQYGERPEAELNGEISDVATTITYDHLSGTLPSVGTIRIDNEEIIYTGKSDTQFTGCTRGANGTIASPHANNSRIITLVLNSCTRGVNGTSPASHSDNVNIKEREKRFKLNFSIDERQPAMDIINDFLLNFGGFFTYTGPKLKLNAERAENSVMSFNEDNIIEGSFRYYQVSKDEVPNYVGVEYIDPEYNWQPIIAHAEDEISQRAREDMGFEPVVPKEVRIWSITDFSQASRQARFYLDLARTCSIYCRFQTNAMGLKCVIGSVIDISHFRPNWSGKPFRTIEMAEAPENRIEIIAREYNADLYDDSYGSGIRLIDYGKPANPLEPVSEVDNLLIEEVNYINKDGVYVSDISVTFNEPTDDSKRFLSHYQIQLKKGTADYKVVGGPTGNSFTISNVEVGVTYYVKVKTVSVNDILSNGVISASLTIQGKTANPPNVSNFAYAFTNELVFTWDKETIADFGGTEIRLEDANWGVQNANLVYRGKTNKHTIVNPGSRTPGTYYARHYDTSGNYSATAQSVTPTNAAPTAPTIGFTQWFGFAKIEWTDAVDDDLRYYEVYKSHTNAWAGEEFSEVKVAGKAAIVQGNAPVDVIADATDATSITDADLIGKGVDYFVGDRIKQTSGTYSGQEATVTVFNNATGKVTVASWPSGTPSINDKFVLKDRAYYKVKGVDTYGGGDFSSAVTIDFTPLAEAEIGDAIISARKLIAGEVITLTAQIKDAIITSAKILSLVADKITTGSLNGQTLTGGTIQTAASGSRVVLTTDSLIGYDDDGNEVFKVILTGADVGDVIFGLSSTAYMKWDRSAGKLLVGDVESPDYVANTVGYKLSKSEGLEINTGKIRGVGLLPKIMMYSMLTEE